MEQMILGGSGERVAELHLEARCRQCIFADAIDLARGVTPDDLAVPSTAPPPSMTF